MIALYQTPLWSQKSLDSHLYFFFLFSSHHQTLSWKSISMALWFYYYSNVRSSVRRWSDLQQFCFNPRRHVISEVNSCTNKRPQQDRQWVGWRTCSLQQGGCSLDSFVWLLLQGRALRDKVLLSLSHTQSLNLNARLARTILSHTFADKAVLNHTPFFTNYKSMQDESAFCLL